MVDRHVDEQKIAEKLLIAGNLIAQCRFNRLADDYSVTNVFREWDKGVRTPELILPSAPKTVEVSAAVKIGFTTRALLALCERLVPKQLKLGTGVSPQMAGKMQARHAEHEKQKANMCLLLSQAGMDLCDVYPRPSKAIQDQRTQFSKMFKRGERWERSLKIDEEAKDGPSQPSGRGGHKPAPLGLF